MQTEEQEITDIMVDIETTGTMPDRTAIIQIAAVKFNRHTRFVSPEFFDRCLTMPPHRYWDMSTSHWWSKQKPSTLQEILRRQEDWLTVITDFAKWAYNAKQSPRFWSKPTTFDFMFLASYFNDANVPNPFHYREATDMNSFLRGLYFPETPPELEKTMPFTGATHNALDDTLHQLKVLFAHMDNLRGKDVSGTAGGQPAD